MPIELRDLARLPPSIENMAFSKIRVERLPEEEATRFFNGLYEAALLSHDDGDWSRVESYLSDWERDLISRVNPNAISFDSSPWTPFEKPLSEARIALLTTGGAYVRDTQEPYIDDDPSYRVISSTTPASDLAIFHVHYDTSNAEKDINVIFPIERLREMAAEGALGSLSADAFGFMGYIVGDNIPRLMEETAPEVARMLVADRVDAALIGTT
ncbi:MAG: hypothetical protein F4X20_07940 [Dehalococcoidia bacterium]|nr:hypothetical protein [Dehalococcoidia bacterium]